MKYLNPSYATSISDTIIALLEDEGYPREEIIPGLIQAVVDLADQDDGLLDEAANFLADGGVVPDVIPWDEDED